MIARAGSLPERTRPVPVSLVVLVKALGPISLEMSCLSTQVAVISPGSLAVFAQQFFEEYGLSFQHFLRPIRQILSTCAYVIDFIGSHVDFFGHTLVVPVHSGVVHVNPKR